MEGSPLAWKRRVFKPQIGITTTSAIKKSACPSQRPRYSMIHQKELQVGVYQILTKKKSIQILSNAERSRVFSIMVLVQWKECGFSCLCLFRHFDVRAYVHAEHHKKLDSQEKSRQTHSSQTNSD